jgi:hypothetical protein
MCQVCFSQLSSFFLTISFFVDTVKVNRRLLEFVPVSGVLADTVSTRNWPVFRRNQIKFRSGAGSFLTACVVCAACCFLAVPSWAAPTGVSEQIAEELDRNLMVSGISQEHHAEERHVMVGDIPLFVSNIDDSISQTPMPQVPADLLIQPEDSESQFQPIPEPSSLALMGGLGGLLFFIHRLRAYFDRSAVG